MKSMTCNQLAGACEEVFTANTFEEMAELSKKHAMEMFAKKDEAHLAAMERMKNMPKEEQMAWFAQKKKEFDALPDN